MDRHVQPFGRTSPAICLLLMLLLAPLRAAAADGPDAVPLYHERYRPQFHFTPAAGWMNDPNGLVFFAGEYHLYFQSRPDSLVQTPVISWGSAVSPDLVHWTQLPVALSPDEHGYIWSGSAVVDWHNTSGFGQNAKPPLVAMYTAAKDPFAQCLAYSLDRGRTWTKYAANPVIPHIAAHNRDPHVFWHAPTHRWIVILFKDVDDTFCLFASPDLKHWTHLQDVQMPGCGECPDFFPLPVERRSNQVKWVITAANGKYLVGDFDGQHFTPQQDVRQVDFGHNFYAVQTFNDIPPADGRRIQIAWMAGGSYPGMPFNQQMSFPATLTLHASPDGYRLHRYPVREIALLHGGAHQWQNLPVTETEQSLPGLTGDTFDITADIDPGTAAEITLTVAGQPIRYSTKTQTLSALGNAPLPLMNHHLQLRILVDRTSLETFASDGAVSLTSCYVPTTATTGISWRTTGGTATVNSLTVYPLKSAWN